MDEHGWKWEPQIGYVANDAKLQSSYASLRIEDVESPLSSFLFYIWLCFVVLQVTMFNIVFQWSGLGELVSMMKRNFCYSIDGLYGECQSHFLEMIGIVVSREWEDEVKDGLYEWDEEDERHAFLREEAKFRFSNCEVAIFFSRNSE